MNCWLKIKMYIFPVRLCNPTWMLWWCWRSSGEHFVQTFLQETLAQQSQVSQGLHVRLSATGWSQLEKGGSSREGESLNTLVTRWHISSQHRGVKREFLIYSLIQSSKPSAHSWGNIWSFCMDACGFPAFTHPRFLPHFPWCTTSSPPKQIQLTQSCNKAAYTTHMLKHTLEVFSKHNNSVFLGCLGQKHHRG